MDGELTPEEVNELVADEEETVCVVDIRDPRRFERGHVPGSVNVPLPELTARIDEVADADRIVTVCPHGKSSVQAARLIGSYEGSADARVESMAGGLTAWTDRFDLVTGSERDGERGPTEGASESADTPF